jgi:hypothetical protein
MNRKLNNKKVVKKELLMETLPPLNNCLTVLE